MYKEIFLTLIKSGNYNLDELGFEEVAEEVAPEVFEEHEVIVEEVTAEDADNLA